MHTSMITSMGLGHVFFDFSYGNYLTTIVTLCVFTITLNLFKIDFFILVFILGFILRFILDFNIFIGVREVILEIILGNLLKRFTWLMHTHRFYPQNGICIQKYQFWPKNDGEKSCRKIYIEILPCGKMVISISEFVILGTFMK